MIPIGWRLAKAAAEGGVPQAPEIRGSVEKPCHAGLRPASEVRVLGAWKWILRGTVDSLMAQKSGKLTSWGW